MSKSRVRAGVGGVGGVDARPPVSRHSSQLSMVPNARSRTGFDAALVEEPAQLGGREVRVEDQAGTGRIRSR